MVVAQVEGGDGWVEQVLQQVVGEGWLLGLVVLVCWFVLCVDHHAGIVACRRSGTRGEWGRSMILRTGVESVGEIKDYFVVDLGRMNPE